jgi:hypothetical protein
VRSGWKLSLDHLAELELDSARWWLQGLPGVGVKVAASVLNFSPLNMRALVVDTHVHRVAGPLGLIPASYDTAHAYRALMDMVPDSWTAEDLYELHWLMKGLGQLLCSHHAPRCGACALKATCPGSAWNAAPTSWPGGRGLKPAGAVNRFRLRALPRMPHDIRIGTAGWSFPRTLEVFPAEGSGLERYAPSSTASRSTRPSTAPPAQDLRALGGLDAAGLPVRGEGSPDDHPRAAAGRLPRTAGPVPRRVRGPGRQARAVADPVAAEPGFEPEPWSASSPPGARRPAPRRCWSPAIRPGSTGRREAAAGNLRGRAGRRRSRRGPRRRRPGGWSGLTYRRLHGSPAMYATSYDDGRLEPLAEQIGGEAKAVESWCVFDNTRFGAATTDALKLMALTAPSPAR